MIDELPQRIPEPELMDEPLQAAAYADADFEQPHSWFMELLQRAWAEPGFDGTVLDLGCGAADISVRLAHAFPRCRVDAIDGAEAMLVHARRAISAAGVDARVRLLHGHLPDAQLPAAHYDAIVSNSLLHHLHEPQVLWHTVRALAAPGTRVFIMDLMRPASAETAALLVQTYSGDEPEILRRDFYNSLLAAFRVEEVQQQLHAAGLRTLQVQAVSDRHLTVQGALP